MQWGTASIRVPEKPFLGVGEVAVAIGVNRKTILRWVREGKFPAPRPVAGGKRKWTAMSVGVWLAWQEYVPPPRKPRAKPGGGETDPPGRPDRGRAKGQ